ncbi:hypothetical protein MUG78_17085 [Gordonia alkaliphila]|uniref:hypothetical protein n=1 Tax=Gordonia alkaliphila TaxID=1053547 RepID=UPI001FF5B291|nr:hypothetical protein [Gordonia alkaliphila]MCK0441116.1 hypothetical protein [Gordonia alkaliphila]
MNNPGQLPNTQGSAEAIGGDSSAQPGTFGALAGGWRLATVNPAGTAAATLLWFLGAMALLASRFAMPVAAQWVLLTAGGVVVYLGAAVLARYLIEPAGSPVLINTVTIRFALTSMLIGFTQFLVIYLAIGFGVRTAAVPGLIIIAIAVLALFAPYYCAANTSLPRALAASARLLQQPRHVAVAVLALVATAVSLMIPPLGLVLMPWQTAVLVEVCRRNPVDLAAP